MKTKKKLFVLSILFLLFLSISLYFFVPELQDYYGYTDNGILAENLEREQAWKLTEQLEEERIPYTLTPYPHKILISKKALENYKYSNGNFIKTMSEAQDIHISFRKLLDRSRNLRISMPKSGL